MVASKRIQSQLIALEQSLDIERNAPVASLPRRKSSKRVVCEASDDGDDAFKKTRPHPTKRLKKRDKALRQAGSTSTILHQRLFSTSNNWSPDAAPVDSAPGACLLPYRHHTVDYHRPLLLHGEYGKLSRSALLVWYDGVNTNRSMPWRKSFVDPTNYTGDAQALREALTQRAYEVFISEVMLQQTRVKTVIDYWNRWMAKWPTIYDLAKAEDKDVMSAWRGLGYYSRCRRILEACKIVVDHPEWQGLMPQDAEILQTQIPGVGPYTAGALSAIVFGLPAAMVDGNVLRVLSRQLGLLADTKTDKPAIGLIWACAQSLVVTVAAERVALAGAQQGAQGQPNDGPGRWGQALMELGSTVCTPRPNCADCPVTATCRAYQEGKELAAARGLCSSSSTSSSAQSINGAVDIEDLCQLCDSIKDTVVPERSEVALVARKAKRATLSAFISTKSKTKGECLLSPEALKVVVDHAQRFPAKVVKKALRVQEILVCAVQRASDGHYLLQKRPEKGG